MDSDSFAWLAVCSLLMLVLIGGFAVAQAGQVRAKNATHALLQVALGTAVVCLVQWALGLRLALGSSAGGWFGSGADLVESAGALGWLFQATATAVPLVIVCGAVAERIRLMAMLAFAAVLGGVIQPVVWHWTQHPSGWLVQLGLVDLTGTAALQIVGAASALAALWVAGPRLGRYGAAGDLRRWMPHNQPLVLVGAGMVWLGWCGLIGSKATTAQVLGDWLWHSQLGGCAGAAVAATWSRARNGTWVPRDIAAGGLAGLVALSAGATVMGPLAAVFTGAVAGAVALGATSLLHRWRLDDASDAIAIHGAAAVWGLLAAGLLRTDEPAATLLGPMLVQALAALSAFAWTFPLAYGALRGVDRLMQQAGGLRIAPRDEMLGLDLLEHGTLPYPERADSLAAIKLDV